MIIIDSNIWIFGEFASAPEHELALRAYRSAIQTDSVGINAIISSEVFHTLYRLSDAGVAEERIVTIVSNPAIDWLEFSRDMVAQAAALARKAGLRINDALIAVQALSIGAKVLTDNVRDFKKVEGLRVLPLRT